LEEKKSLKKHLEGDWFFQINLKLEVVVNKILITGGAGYVGSGLLRELLKNGFDVVCVDKLMFGGEALLDIWDNRNFKFIKCDISDYITFDKVLENYDFFAVIHLAAVVGDPACKREPDLAKRINWEASKHLLDKCIDLRIPRFVFASTCSNYGKMKDPNSYVDEK
jgi:nucleoside-diphosphate-sugar epimerase